MKKYIYAFIATICLPLCAQAQLLELTSDNFPDDKFLAFVSTFDTDGEEGLSEAEILAVTSMDCSNLKIADLTGIEYFSNLETLDCSNNKLTSLEVTPLEKLVKLNCHHNKNLASLTVGNYFLEELYANNCNLTSADLSNCPALKKIRLYRNPNLASAYFGEISEVVTLEIFECSLTSLDITKMEKLDWVSAGTNQLKELDLSGNPVLTNVTCEENQISELDFSKNPDLETVRFENNTISEIDVTILPNLELLWCGDNLLKELDLSKNTKLYSLRCENNEISKLDVTNSPDLLYIQCENNHLTTLDLSKNTKLAFVHSPGHSKFYDISPQTAVIDAIVVGDNREKVALPLIPSSESSEVKASQFSNLKVDKKSLDASLVEANLVVADDPKADVDLYGKTASYDYLVPCGTEGATADQTKMNVTITTYPYVMYVNPNSKDDKDPFYSGTLIVDYDAEVPEGAEAYIATDIQVTLEEMYYDGMKRTFDQLQMTKVGDAGDVIPANTPIYVKAATENGLFAFGRNIEEKEVVTIPEGNILQGTLTDLDVDYQSVLTLGREQGKGTGMVGFWRYRGQQVAAHRAYIPASVLTSTESSGDVKGLVLNFNNDATGIRQIESNEESGAWYNLQGMQMAAPVQKGIYIQNGKKFIVR
ncbi:MAG: hypothetical protein J5661_01110 [Bacteroidaceae bacterium]|nr:hypothetical protein [Bacteroidaceae bacterium]